LAITSALIRGRAGWPRIRGKVRIGSAGRKNHDAALLQVPYGAAPDVRLGQLAHFNGGHDARRNAHLLQRVGERQGVDDGGSMPIWSAVTRSMLWACRGHSAENIAATHHHADLNARRHIGDFAPQLLHRSASMPNAARPPRPRRSA